MMRERKSGRRDGGGPVAAHRERGRREKGLVQSAFPWLNLRTIGSSWPTSPIQSCLQCFTINTIHCNTKCLICSIICQKFTAPGYMKQVNRS
ncbi:hypothetical protein Hdeb2414_s0024g00654481 [Helianthus debilis subsp. tardiflorus]